MSGAESVQGINQKHVHRMLVERTNKAHETLHNHPIISQLLAKDIPVNLYHRILVAYYRFFLGVENRRKHLSTWDEFSLQLQLTRMERDLNTFECRDDLLELKPMAQHTDIMDPYWISCPISCFGGLYVLHGSAFGAQMMHHCLKKSLPTLPHYFFSGGIQRDCWELLTAKLCQIGGNESRFEVLANSVNLTYRQFGEWVR